MEANNQTAERRLCSGCHAFYGGAATDFMCSKCFKESSASQGATAAYVSPSKRAPMANIVDAITKPSDFAPAPSEPVPSSPTDIEEVKGEPTEAVESKPD